MALNLLKICLFYSLSYLVSTRYLDNDPLFPTTQQEVDQLFSSDMEETGTETEMRNFGQTESRINVDMMSQPEVENTRQTFPEIEDTKETRQEVERSTDMKKVRLSGTQRFEIPDTQLLEHLVTGLFCPVIEPSRILRLNNFEIHLFKQLQHLKQSIKNNLTKRTLKLIFLDVH